MTMLLSDEDSKLYFRLWLQLLKFVNETYRVVPGIFQSSKIPDIDDLEIVQDKLVHRIDCIDRYLDRYEFTDEEASIVSSWRNLKSGDFYVIRHRKKYSVFYCPDLGDTLFGVMGITSTIDELIQRQPLPAYIKAVLLPFKNNIITTGIIVSHRMTFGEGIKAELTERYREIAQRNGICMRLT